ncbi:MAG: FecR family protein [Bacteroidales bacterium]
MKKFFNIVKPKKNHDAQFIDSIMEKNTLSYRDINFKHTEIDTLHAYQELNKSIELNKPNSLYSLITNFNWQPFLKPAYTVVLTTIVLLTILIFRKETDKKHYAEIIVEKGEKIKLNVSEDLTIWINSESFVKIPTNGKIGKEIYIEGEAFIETSPTNKKSYSIISGNTICSIKNGAFNIKTDPMQVIATVTKGTIDFYNTNLPKSTQITLEEKDKATLFKKHDFIAVETEKSLNYLYWKTGILKFENTDLVEVAKTLTKFFNIPVQVNNTELKNLKFSATFTNPEIDDILDKIQSTINCQIAGDGSKLLIN